MMNDIVEGCVHGRFQPPHQDHLAYIREALNRCQRLTIGIAQPDAPKLDECEVDPHRAQSVDNPLSYAERTAIIERMLLESGVTRAQFSFSKFPIDRGIELVSHVPTSVRCFTTIMNDWNLRKIEILENLGYTVDVLWDRRGEPHIEGSNVRQLIRAGDNAWKQLVHPAAVEFMITHDLVSKIANVTAGDGEASK